MKLNADPMCVLVWDEARRLGMGSKASGESAAEPAGRIKKCGLCAGRLLFAGDNPLPADKPILDMPRGKSCVTLYGQSLAVGYTKKP